MRQPVDVSAFENFDRLCGVAAGPIGVGVSGGSDSLALLELAKLWAEPRDTSLIALTFDHGLRPESASEAAKVGAIASELGIPHQTLTWASPQAKPALARRARHAALAQAVREAGGNCLMLGHTADDQRETFLMRARQGSHWYGLAGIREIAVSAAWPEGRGVTVLRPILHETRAELQDWLSGRGRTWVSDPSNENTAYERVRMRELLSEHTALETHIDGVQARLAHLRAAEDKRLAGWMTNCVTINAGGDIAVESADLPIESLSRGLSLLLQMASGNDTPPRGPACLKLAQRLKTGQAFRGQTLGGVDIRRGKNGVLLSRESAAIDAVSNDDNIWDNRFERVSIPSKDAVQLESGPANWPANTAVRCLIPLRFSAFVRMLTPIR